MRALAVTGAKRSPLFPDVPTVAEAGLPGYEAELHYGIVAPAGTPPEVIAKLNAALNNALADGESGSGLPSTAPRCCRARRAYAADIASEEAKWCAIIKQTGKCGPHNRITSPRRAVRNRVSEANEGEGASPQF